MQLPLTIPQGPFPVSLQLDIIHLDRKLNSDCSLLIPNYEDGQLVRLTLQVNTMRLRKLLAFHQRIVLSQIDSAVRFMESLCGLLVVNGENDGSDS